MAVTGSSLLKGIVPIVIGRSAVRSLPLVTSSVTLTKYSTLIRQQLEIVGVTEGILRGIPSQETNLLASTTSPVIEVNLFFLNMHFPLAVGPLAVKVWVWKRETVGVTGRLELFSNLALIAMDSPGQYPFLSV